MHRSGLSLTLVLLAILSLLAVIPRPLTANGNDDCACSSSQDEKAKLDQLLKQAADLRQQAKWPELTTVAEEALRLSRQTGDKTGIAKSLFYVASAHGFLSMFKDAIETYKQAIPLLDEIGEKLLLGLSLQNLGVAFGSLGFFEEMLEYQLKARAVFRDAGERAREANVTAGVGVVYMELGEYERADEVFQGALGLARDLKNLDLQARVLSLLGILENRRARYPQAINYTEQSLALNTELKHDGRQRENFQNLASCYQELRDYQKATRNYEQAIALARKMGSAHSVASLTSDSALILLEQSRFSEALDLLGRSRAVLRQFGDASLEGEATARIGKAQRALGRNEEALASYREALAIIKRFRASSFPSESLRAGKGALGRRTFVETVDLLVSLKREAEALKVAEDYRARAFLDQMAESRVDARQDLTEKAREREDKHYDRISAIQKQLFQENLSVERDRQLKAELAAAENELEAFQLDLRRTSPRYANVQYAETLGVEGIQQKLLDTNTALIEFMLGERQSFVWVISHNKLTVAALGPRKQIEESVTAYRRMLTRRASALTMKSATAEIQAQSRRLYEMLLLPVEPALSTSRSLIIVPDGPLAYLPFETLNQPAGQEKTSSRPRYLLERCAISYAPSATALAAIKLARKQAAAPQKLLLAFGDPVYREDKSGEGKGSVGATRSPATDTVGFYRERGFDLMNLPFTRTEVAGIMAVYRGERCKAHLGSDAREEAVRAEKLDEYRYIHFAAHGTVDEERPARSAVALSLDGKSKEDGMLQVGEIMRLKLNADMVTLSACSTGLGKLVDGEGLLGLARAFFYAGSSSVVASLWNVNDASTAQLMKSFYSGLNRGLSKDAALREAKLSLMKSSQAAWQHPYFWAAFVLAGDAR